MSTRAMGRDRGRGRGRGGRGSGRGRAGYTDRSNREDFRSATNDSGTEMNADLPERFRGSRPAHQNSFPVELDNSFNLTLNMDIRQYIHKQEQITSSADSSEWLGQNEIPTNDEIAVSLDAEPAFMPNKQEGKWKKKEKYLKAHYELLREDAVTPLRDAVHKFRRSPDMDDDHSLSIYEKVHIIGFTFSQLGIAARVKFSTARARRRILWQASRRLVAGTLVALSPANDKFQTKNVVALVAARSLQGVNLNPPEVDIFFSRDEDIQIDPQQEWTMVEAKTGYYEAHRHTLRALQKLSQENFPLSEHICTMSTTIEPPQYLVDRPKMDLTPATRDGQDTFYGQHDVLQDWPSAGKSGLDATQWDALNQILTKRLAIVQGPPGTGKTFVSKVALEILNSYVTEDDPPVIIAAQTNHALDQLLGHVGKFEPRYIRLGGRSTNAEVKSRALYEIRKMERLPPIPNGLYGKASSSWKKQSETLMKILEPFHQDKGEPLPLATFLEHGIVSQKQSDSLSAGAARWISSDGNESDPLKLWMGRALSLFEVDYNQDSFGFVDEEEDEDLEYEQVREHEAEHGAADEEDAQLLKGPWCSVEEKWIARSTSVETDLEKAAELLDTVPDLWQVPEALRGPMYAIMSQRLKSVLLDKFRAEATLYNKNLRDLKIGKWERDSIYLQRAKVIGMTTTGLSKYRPLIASIKPKIILIEEAAEVIEAPVTVACMESVEHLILVGDHQQLQGHCSVRDLEGYPYFLNVSMFERLVNNRIPFKTLLRQRRMDPAFRLLISSIYPELADHESISQRQATDWGMSNVNSFFFTHEWSEYKDASMSTYNEEEAIFVAGFYRYLVCNGVPHSAVTILTFYNGQRKRLLKEIRKYPELASAYNNVKTVDSYQGEENSIILLSLARSNSEGKIGFLDVNNRVCVALSRAKLGFYIFGNSRLLGTTNLLWNNVVRTMSGQQRIGDRFPIFCQRHKRTTLVEYADDWQKHDGGCLEPCGMRLNCGHTCQLKCHPFDHDKVACQEECRQVLSCGHQCDQKCSEECSCECTAFTGANGGNRRSQSDFRSSDVRLNGSGNSNGDRTRTRSGADNSSWDTGRTGQHMSPNMQDNLYLPRQSLNQSKTSLIPTRVGMPQAITPLLPFGDPSSTGPKFLPYRQAVNISPEEKAMNGKEWNRFASGGSKVDDARREEMQSWPSIPARRNLTPIFEAMSTEYRAKDQTQKLSNGRKKFTTTYEPAAVQSEREAEQFPDIVAGQLQTQARNLARLRAQAKVKEEKEKEVLKEKSKGKREGNDDTGALSGEATLIDI